MASALPWKTFSNTFGEEIFLILILIFPWCGLRPFPLVLLPVPFLKPVQTTPALTQLIFKFSRAEFNRTWIFYFLYHSKTVLINLIGLPAAPIKSLKLPRAHCLKEKLFKYLRYHCWILQPCYLTFLLQQIELHRCRICIHPLTLESMDTLVSLLSPGQAWRDICKSQQTHSPSLSLLCLQENQPFPQWYHETPVQSSPSPSHWIISSGYSSVGFSMSA